MRAYVKWLGVAMVVTGVASFPMAIWMVTAPWAVVCLLLVMAGCVLLLFAPRPAWGSAPEADASEVDGIESDGVRSDGNKSDNTRAGD